MAALTGPHLPSKRTVAFALSIVKSKPPELPIAEYISLLRQHIAKGRRENTLSAAYHHLDRSSYWRAEHERTQERVRKAESENIELRREITTLKAKVESAKVTQPKKRKRADEDVIPYPRSPKKARQDASLSAQKSVPPSTANEDDFDPMMDFGKDGDTLLLGLHQVHAALRTHPIKTDAQALAYGISKATGALPHVIDQALQLQTTNAATRLDLARPMLLTAGRSFRSLVAGFTRLAEIDTRTRFLGHITYALVQMYQTLLEFVDKISASEVQHSVIRAGQQASPTKPSSKSSKIPLLEGGPILDLYMRTLAVIVDELDPINGKHQPLFEGFAYVVLNFLGSRLYLGVFGRPRGRTIEDEIMAMIDSDAAPSNDDGTPHAQETHKRRAVKLEAPYLIHLFERLMKAAPAHLGAALAGKMSKAKSSSPKVALSVVAKERLQRTLVNCIFGNNGSDHDDPFRDCLKIPPILAAPVALPRIKDEDVDGWFQEEMWRLLGWEILAKEGDW